MLLPLHLLPDSVRAAAEAGGLDCSVLAQHTIAGDARASNGDC